MDASVTGEYKLVFTSLSNHVAAFAAAYGINICILLELA